MIRIYLYNILRDNHLTGGTRDVPAGHDITNSLFPLQRTGQTQMNPMQELYGKVPRGPSLGPRPGMEEMEFSDDDASPLTEPIYNGR